MFYDVFGPHSNLDNDFDRFFDRVSTLLARGPRWATVNQDTALNVWANDDHVALTSEVPGIDPASLELSIVGDTVTLSGKREVVRDGAETKDGTWHRRERASYAFQRSIQLPYRVDADQAEAKVKDGVLTVTLRRLEADKPRAITVSAA
jgi:HSP20 family protein